MPWTKYKNLLSSFGVNSLHSKWVVYLLFFSGPFFAKEKKRGTKIQSHRCKVKNFELCSAVLLKVEVWNVCACVEPKEKNPRLWSSPAGFLFWKFPSPCAAKMCKQVFLYVYMSSVDVAASAWKRHATCLSTGRKLYYVLKGKKKKNLPARGAGPTLSHHDPVSDQGGEGGRGRLLITVACWDPGTSS